MSVVKSQQSPEVLLKLAIYRSALSEIDVVAQSELDDASKVNQILAIVKTTLDPDYTGEHLV